MCKETTAWLTQSLKTGSVVLKKRVAWTRTAESVNAVGGQGRAQTPSTGLRHPSFNPLQEGAGKRCSECGEGGQCRPETLEGHATRPKAATRTGGGPPEPPVPYEDFILTILDENSNRITT